MYSKFYKINYSKIDWSLDVNLLIRRWKLPKNMSENLMLE